MISAGLDIDRILHFFFMTKYSKFTENVGSGNFTDTFCKNNDKFQKATHTHTGWHALDCDTLYFLYWCPRLWLNLLIIWSIFHYSFSLSLIIKSHYNSHNCLFWHLRQKFSLWGCRKIQGGVWGLVIFLPISAWR